MKGAVVAAILVSALLPRTAPAQSPDFVVVDTFPHDDTAFTEGLDFYGKRLYEGTGQYGESDLRRVDLQTGEVKRRRPLAERFFGEGVTQFKQRLFQLTWREQRAFVYRLDSWERIKTFKYRGEGWGLTHNKNRLIMSNGSDRIVFRDPSTFRITRRIDVSENGEPVSNLNELEWVQGKILANVFPTDFIVRIDPSSGRVERRYDLSSLRDQEGGGSEDVTNGIAFRPAADRLFVTGKNWAHLYEIRLAD